MASSITGYTKVFYQNYLLSQTYDLSVSSGESTRSNLYDIDRDTAWTSVNSDDTTAETIQFDFTSSQTIDRIVLINMNFKDFGIQYWNGAAWDDFTNVYSLYDDSADSEISFTDNSQSTRYFEFDSVSTSKIKITVTKTIVVDAQKYLYELYIGREMGTFVDDIASSPNEYVSFPRSYNNVTLLKSNFGAINIETSNKFYAELTLEELWETSDQTLVQNMLSEKEMSWYPCGAKDDYTQVGWRLQDFYSVIAISDLSGQFSIGRDKDLGINQQIIMHEQ